jgi:hypothetical protein
VSPNYSMASVATSPGSPATKADWTSWWNLLPLANTRGSRPIVTAGPPARPVGRLAITSHRRRRPALDDKSDSMADTDTGQHGAATHVEPLLRLPKSRPY